MNARIYSGHIASRRPHRLAWTVGALEETDEPDKKFLCAPGWWPIGRLTKKNNAHN